MQYSFGITFIWGKSHNGTALNRICDYVIHVSVKMCSFSNICLVLYIFMKCVKGLIGRDFIKNLTMERKLEEVLFITGLFC